MAVFCILLLQYPALLKVRHQHDTELHYCTTVDFANAFQFSGKSEFKNVALSEAASKFVEFVRKVIARLEVVKKEADDPKRQLELYVKSMVKRFATSKSGLIRFEFQHY